MTKVVCAEDCGNSPKILLLKKFLTALARGEDAFVLRNLSQDITWERVGETAVHGKGEVSTLLQQMKREIKTRMVIQTIITHGPAGAANGTMELKNGKTYAFSHVYRFRGAADTHIQHITAYLIEI